MKNGDSNSDTEYTRFSTNDISVVIEVGKATILLPRTPYILFRSDLSKMIKGDVRTKFVHLEKYLKSRAQSYLFVFQIIFLRLICVGVCAGSSYWLYRDFIGARKSPEFPPESPQRDLNAGFNCLLPDEYQWTDPCVPVSENSTCTGTVSTY